MLKVSVISPCYNGEQYLPHFLDSMLSQTYSNVEFIFVNDGSEDNTESIFESYKQKLEQKGWTVIYIKQDNKGLASAINSGLQLFSGDYLMWPDSDDILFPNHIEAKVRLMEQNPECALGFCKVQKVKEGSLQPTGMLYRSHSATDTLFEDLIYNYNIVWTPISSIVRSQYFLMVYPDRTIYPSRGGQDFQMYLPLAAKFRACYTDEILAQYVVRSNSMSNKKSSKIAKFNNLLNIWFHTICKYGNLDCQQQTEALTKAIDYFSFVKPQTFSLRLFGILPLLTVVGGKRRKVKLFNFITICSLVKKKSLVVVKLFGLLPIFSYR